MDNSELLGMLPKYRCHKVVKGAKITDIIARGDQGMSLILETPEELRTQSFESTIVEVTPDWVVRFNPVIGNWLVLYEDGYVSTSPDAAWRAGYTLLIEDGPENPAPQPGMPKDNMAAMLCLSARIDWHLTVEEDLKSIKAFVEKLDLEINKNIAPSMVKNHYADYRAERIKQYIAALVQNPMKFAELPDEPKSS